MNYRTIDVENFSDLTKETYSECDENENKGAEECVMKIRGAGRSFTGIAHMMTHHLHTRR